MVDFPDNENEAREERFRDLSLRAGISSQFFTRTIQAAVNFSLVPARAAADLRHWRQWGARNLGGRVRDLVQDPRNPSTWYAGSAQGGVFRSDDGGDTWRPVGNPEDSFPVGAIALEPSNPAILYVGTGEPMLAGAAEVGPSGLGFFTFNPVTQRFVNEVGPALPPAPLGGFPAGAANSYAKIVVDPRVPGRCWIASQTGLWRREPGPPVSFVAETIPLPAAPVTDVVLIEGWNASRPNTYRILATVAGTGIFRGVFDPNPVPATAWEPVLANFNPAAPAFDRIRLDYCASFPNHMYAVFGAPNTAGLGSMPVAAVYHSSDGGDTWNLCTLPPGLGSFVWWTMCVGVHAHNPGIVVVGSMNVARSLDFGRTWQLIIDWRFHTPSDRAQHGDNHSINFDGGRPTVCTSATTAASR